MNIDPVFPSLDRSDEAMGGLETSIRRHCDVAAGTRAESRGPSADLS